MKKLSTTKLIDKVKFLETFRNVDPNMPVSQILFLLAVALEPERSMRSLAESSNVPYASASRYLQALSDGRPAMGVKGLGLVQADENPMDRKQKLVSLTAAGEKLLEEII